MSESAFIVQIAIKRVQSYLFAVPRLGAMVGANAIMGETLRGAWDGKLFNRHVESLPLLAQEAKREGPDRVWGLPPGADLKELEEPLQSKADDWFRSGLDAPAQDDPYAVACTTGVLVRDGGHFRAVFPNADSAAMFCADARRLIARKLPGLRLEFETIKLVKDGENWKKTQASRAEPMIQGTASLGIPHATVCEYSGSEFASEKHTEDSAGAETALVGPSVKARLERCKAFDKGDTHDVLGILMPKLFPESLTTGQAREFSKLSRSGFLAIVKVDGNSVGRRSQEFFTNVTEEDYFRRWAREEEFFVALRREMRAAFAKAVQDTFPSAKQQKNIPVRVLMLGGDDLLLVCDAPYALPFVVNLANALHTTTSAVPDNEGPLTIGAGVAIVSDSFPFYRGHDLAEQLTTSAKCLKHEGRSINSVDWLVTSEAWYGDVGDTRRTQYISRDNLLLSHKPYPILGKGETLQSLLNSADDIANKIDTEKVARSQLQILVKTLRDGRYAGIMAADALPKELRKLLVEHKFLSKNGEPWFAVEETFATRLLDLLELVELSLMKKRVRSGVQSDTLTKAEVA